MAFGRIIRWSRIPASELGPARGPLPAGLLAPRYLDLDDEDEAIDRPQRDAPAARASAVGERALLQPGSPAGNIAIQLVDAVLGIVRGVLGQAAGPAAPLVARALPRVTPASVAAAQARAEAAVEREGALAAERDAANRLVAPGEGQALAHSRGAFEILGTSAIAIDVETVRGRESITIPFERVGPEDVLEDGAGSGGVRPT